MCHYISAETVMPGYGCCRCRTYNGLQRMECKVCREPRCFFAVPADVVRCPGCGFGFGEEHRRALGAGCPVCHLPLAMAEAHA